MRLHTVFLLTVFLLTVTLAHAGDHDPNADEKEGAAPAHCSALGLIFGKNPPATTAELTARLRAEGEIIETDMPFSEAPDPSSFEEPRHLIALGRPTERPGVLAPDLAGRIFFGLGLKCNREKKTVDVKKVEFLSWNFTTKRFDFGVIEGMNGGQVVAKLVPRAQCVTCHKTGGPIFRVDPWTNSVAERVVGTVQHKVFQSVMPDYKKKDFVPFGERDWPLVNGLDLASARSESFDVSVRHGNELLRGQRLPGYLKAADRTAFATARLKAMMYGDFTYQGPFRFDEGVEPVIKDSVLGWKKRVDGTQFPPDAAELRNDRLPISGTLTEAIGMEYEGSRDDEKFEKALLAFAEKRFKQKPDPKDPRSPRNFEGYLNDEQRRNPFYFQGTPAVDPSPPALADLKLPNPTIEALEKAIDRVLALEKLPRNGANWAKLLNRLTDEILAGAPFEKFHKAGHYPERHEYMPAFYASLNQLMVKKYKLPGDFENPLKFDQRFADCVDGVAKEDAPTQSTGAFKKCSSCHTGSNVPNRLRFPFDPYDAAARDAWVKGNDPKIVHKELTRFQTWLFDNEKMPPPDSDEAKGFDRDSPENRSLREWLKAKLVP